MKLQSKFGIAVACASISIIIFTSFFILVFLHDVTHETEHDYIDEIQHIIKHSSEDQITYQSKMLQNIAWRDDTCSFVMNRTEDYIRSNLNPENFQNLETNIIIITDQENKIIYQRYFDYINKEDIPITFDLQIKIDEYISLLKNYTNVSGIVMFDDRPFIFSANKVYSSDMTKNSNATIVFAKYFNQADLDILSSMTNNSFEIVEHRSENAKMISEETFIDEQEDYFVVYTMIKDTFGNEIGYYKTTLPRDIHKKYHKAYTTFLISTIIYSFLVGLIFFIVMQKLIIKRIYKMDNLIYRIIKTDNLSQRLPVHHDDEISHLWKKFNRLLASLSANRIQLKKDNQKIQKSNVKLKELDYVKDTFLSNISHDIKTPLTGIKSYSELLMEGDFGKLNKRQKSSVRIIHQCTDRLIELVSNLLELTRFEARKEILHFEKHDILKLIKNIIKEFSPTLNNAGGNIKIHIDKAIETPLMLIVDISKMSRVIQNILINSIKYKHEKRKLHIEISVSHLYILGEKYARISFKDNGIGISKKDLAKIFDKFYQVEQKNRKDIAGSGLGLPIVKHIVKAHKGRIDIKSQPDSYTEIIIDLPYTTDLKTK